MKLTLGQAAKEVGISKPSLSAAIKKGRLSAMKNESGVYQIDPAELFRVYPPTNRQKGKANTTSLTPSNPVSPGVSDALDLLLGEKDRLIAEKEKAITRLEDEKGEIRKDLEAQREQAKRITMLLENKSSTNGNNDYWRKALDALESRITNQEESAKERDEREEKILRQNRALKKALEEERGRGFFAKLFN